MAKRTHNIQESCGTLKTRDSSRLSGDHGEVHIIGIWEQCLYGQGWERIYEYVLAEFVIGTIAERIVVHE